MMDNNNSQNKKKTMQGLVVSNKMQKTVIVRVTTKHTNVKYGRLVEKSKKYSVHTDIALKEGDEVTIMDSKPISKTKHWVVISKNNKD